MNYELDAAELAELETRETRIKSELEDIPQRIEVMEKELSDIQWVLRAHRLGIKMTLREVVNESPATTQSEVLLDHMNDRRGNDEQNNAYEFLDGDHHGPIVKATTPNGFIGQGYTADQALSAARWYEAQAAKSYIAQPRLTDPEVLESGLTIAIDDTLLWANLSYNEADDWRQRIWTLSCELSNPAIYHRPPPIKIIPAIFPAEA